MTPYFFSRAATRRGLVWVVITCGALSVGCQTQERAQACARLASGFEPVADAGTASNESETLDTWAHRATEAATRLPKGETGPLAPVVKDAHQQLRALAEDLATAANYRRAENAPRYAAARMRIAATKRKLEQLAGEFLRLCR